MGRGAGPAQPDRVKPSSLWRRLARRWRDPVIILPYLGYGTPQKLIVRGRVLEDEGFPPSTAGDSRWRNLVSFYKRLESDEVPGARLRARFRGVERETLTDDEGYFRIEMPVSRAATGRWHQVELQLLDLPARATAQVLVPSRRARFAVISDIDDTIVRTNVASKLKMILTVALTNARTRLPFPGVAGLYRALHAGVNPLFYVSKSPWNLYAPLVEYLEVQGLPLGPLLLRDFGWRPEKAHKRKSIEDLLQTYPKLPFVLIGDDGEDDPEIYRDIERRFPGRVRSIYIRALRTGKRLDESSSSKAAVSRGGLK
jgi:phosphatidate phosphatase APP1